MVTDNQSPWTLGCYGNNEILTPNIDALAQDGIRFTDAFCSNPVCSPNRATILTGLMPSQHGVHRWLGEEKPNAQMGPDAYCTIREFENLPELLAGQGYKCGMSGKWHLGDSARAQLGFEYWFSMTQGHTASFYDMPAVWNGEEYAEPRYFTDATADHAVSFLHQARGNEPFFLYVGFNGPYCVDGDLLNGHRNRYTDYYADKELPCFPREEIHPWQHTFKDAIGNPVAFRSYAAAVSGIDDGAGRILDELDRLGLSDSTVVVFTADHGSCAGHHGLWGFGEHARPFNLYQEALRVPLIFRYPGRIPGAATISHLSCNYDVYPSLVSLLGVRVDTTNGENLNGRFETPGRDYSRELKGEKIEWGEEIVFHEYETARAVQTPEWKLVKRYPDGPDELYDMKQDPGEKNNLAGADSVATIRRELETRIALFFECYSTAEYDVWRGGRSKAGDILDQKPGS